MIRNLSNMILNFFEEQEAYRLARKNHELREKIKQNEKTALGIHRSIEVCSQVHTNFYVFLFTSLFTHLFRN